MSYDSPENIESKVLEYDLKRPSALSSQDKYTLCIQYVGVNESTDGDRPSLLLYEQFCSTDSLMMNCDLSSPPGSNCTALSFG